MPKVNSKVYYFPQGHAEHSQGNVDFSGCPGIPSMILCRVAAIKFMADLETDEVFAKMHLVPVRPNEPDYGDQDSDNNGLDTMEKPASFAKTLTQSDANNGGGFSVPRYCAETIFPRLDYSADPPVQTVLAKDVHGEIWKFRHIYRGTPRRHLLTTGWSTFVNQKKLVAGDSIVFLRAENGDLCIGIRRAKKGIGSGLESPSRWNSPNGNFPSPYGLYSTFMKEEDTKLMGNGSNGNPNLGGSALGGKGRVRAESVVHAATLAAKGHPFEVVYYPRASTPEFCVKASSVREAIGTRWCSGMRFKMAFETEDSSRISWFMGTISAVQLTDPLRWPNSPWRLLKVTWDEPDLLQNVKSVSPWLVELVSNMPAIHMAPFSPPRKKMRHPDFAFDNPSQIPNPIFYPNNFGPVGGPLCYLPNRAPAGIQGARHAQIDVLSHTDPQQNKLQSSLFPSGFHLADHHQGRAAACNVSGSPMIVDDNISCLLTIGIAKSEKKSSGEKASPFMLFGQPILVEPEASISSGNSAKNHVSEMNEEKSANHSDGSGSSVLQSSPPSDNSSCDRSPHYKEAGHCKVFVESMDLGRTLDLSILSSYEELCERLADMFGILKSEVMRHVLYRNSSGAVKHMGDEPFSDFMKTAKRLTILMADSGSDNIRQ